ncbi:MAG: hypothetical protein J6T60_15915 [Bacteroidales bacterium]|nr:hypothetical protein [Bacteroidales bacterium]
MNKLYKAGIAALAAVSMLAAACSSEEPGTLKGEFSVSETQKVKFAQGNLQYDPATKAYKLADNQWTTVSSTHYAFKPKAEDGVIDRMAWANPDDPYTPSETFTDWGQKPIANGGDKPGIWRTLTADEWEYLIVKRPKSTELFSFGSVNDVKGFILLPDAWQLPKDATMKFIPVDSLNKSSNSFRTKRTDPTDYSTLNAYTAEQWKALEDAGALFLPFTVITELGGKTYYSGEYWTTDDNYASITPQEIWPKRGCRQESFRMSVRLAKDVKK